MTVSAGSIEIDDLSAPVRRKLPGYPLPVLRIARLAVDVAMFLSAREVGLAQGASTPRAKR